MRFVKLEQADKEILRAILESAPSGLDIGEVRRAIRVIDKIEEAGELLALEDAEYDYLKARFAQAKFVRVSRELVELADRLDGAATVNPAD